MFLLFTKPVSYYSNDLHMSVTIRRIAKDLKLAVSTVSKALHDSYEISEETKRKVFDYAQKLQYVPNPYAGSLKSRKTRNIAVVLPEVYDSFFSNAINGIDSIARAKGYHVIVYLTHESVAHEEAILQDLRNGRVDGVLISVSVGVKKDSLVHTQLAKELPLIFFDRICEGIDTTKVVTDDYEASYQATELLISRGCKEIVFLSMTKDLSIIKQRRDGFLKALSDHKIKIAKQPIVLCKENEVENIIIFRNLLTRKTKVDGVICSVEKLVIQFYIACRECGVSIPNQVKVIAFCNLQTAALLSPSLSVVIQPAFEMGQAAATLLFKVLTKKGSLKNEQVVIPSVLVARDSTA